MFHEKRDDLSELHLSFFAIREVCYVFSFTIGMPWYLT